MKTHRTWISCGKLQLYSELYVPDVVSAPALLICHGMNARGSQGLRLYARLAQLACKEGFVSLVFDFQGVGKSGGVFDYGFGEQENVKCALDFLAGRPEAASNKIFVIGHSLGGAVSLYALQNEKRVKGLALWSTPKNHNYNVRKFIRRTKGRLGLYKFLVLSRVDKVFNISKLFELEVYGVSLRPKYVREKLMQLDECEATSKLNNIPLLIAVGRNDDIVGVDEAEEIYRSAHEPKTMLVIESADHIYKGKEQELITKTLDWIKKLV